MMLLRKLALFALLASSATAATTKGPCALKFQGVNLAAADFGEGSNNHALSPNPGVEGTNYRYTEPGGSATFFASNGMNTLRVPVKWERLQGTLGGSLTQNDLQKLTAVVNTITNTLGKNCIIDIHNYARYNGVKVAASGSSVTDAHLAQFWSLLAAQFKSNSKVIFGLMNEPYSMDTAGWVNTANTAIAAIRKTGATNLIMVPGTRYTGAGEWATSGGDSGIANSVALLKIVDPGKNFAIEMHQYLDSDSSGTHAQCVSATFGAQKLQFATTWLRKNNLKGFLGEFGASSDSLCLTSIDQMLTFMEGNADVWLGWTWWAAGPWWGNYMYSVEPYANGTAPIQFKILKAHTCTTATV